MAQPPSTTGASSYDDIPGNLPTAATPLIGREREVAAARQRLLREEVRLLTLTGPTSVSENCHGPSDEVTRPSVQARSSRS